MNIWFISNLLSLNLNKTHYLEFRTNSSSPIDTNISYNNKYIVNTTITQFLGLIIDTTLSWKNHIDKLMDKLSKAYYAIREVKPFITQALRMIYFSYIHIYYFMGGGGGVFFKQ